MWFGIKTSGPRRTNNILPWKYESVMTHACMQPTDSYEICIAKYSNFGTPVTRTGGKGWISLSCIVNPIFQSTREGLQDSEREKGGKIAMNSKYLGADRFLASGITERNEESKWSFGTTSFFVAKLFVAGNERERERQKVAQDRGRFMATSKAILRTMEPCSIFWSGGRFLSDPLFDKQSSVDRANGTRKWDKFGSTFYSRQFCVAGKTGKRGKDKVSGSLLRNPSVWLTPSWQYLSDGTRRIKK